MKVKIRILSLLLAVVLTITGVNLTVFAEEASSDKVLTIQTEKEWNALAKKCKSNTYSEGLTVLLKKDLELSADAKVIPYFAGTFDGAGHQITGEEIRREESDLALFSETGENATISNLKVSLKIMAQDGQENVGGIVGTNRGTVVACTYTGIVSGETNVGGIAANNEKSGQIVDCKSRGVIAGENKTGGIVGNNQGTIYRCENQGAVNISISDEGAQLSSVEENLYKIWKEESLEELVPSSSDTGGICGYSSGIITECKNEGVIGYAHVGYNVGGIAGRQCGYVGNCVNTGNVHGRKDVGGIVGQAVPDVTIVYGEDTIANMRDTLKCLESLMEQTTRDANQASKTVSKRLNQVSGYVDVAMDSTDNIYHQVDDNVSANVDTINDTSAKAKSYLHRMTDVTSNLSSATQKTEKALKSLDVWYQDYKEQIGNLQETDEVKKAASDVQTTSRAIVQTYASDDLNWNEIENWNSEDWQQLKAQIDKLDKALDLLANAAQDKRLDEAMKEMKEASALMTDAVDDADVILHELDTEEEISVKQPDSQYYDETDRLNGALYGISEQLSLLNNEMSGESDALIKDIEGISQQFSILMDLFINELSDMQNFNPEDVYVDASDEEIAGTTQGKITGGQNHGFIEGDVNVGGIVGTMAIEYAEDPEDDLDETRNKNLKITYQTKVVVEDSSNDGDVVSKKNCVGAVVGRMDIGVITGCLGSGVVQSTTGDYVGGVCGYALSGIRNSDSKAILKGRDYIGGIAGVTSDTISDSNSMVNIAEYKRYGAAIAGDADDVSGIKNCYYVSENLSGVNRIDYAGSAEEVTYEELLSQAADSDSFASFTVVFCLDEENKNQTMIETRKQKYGDIIYQSDYPKTKEKKGYYVVWEKDKVEVSGLTIVSGRYVAYDTLLESEAKDKDGRPLVMVDGQFKDTDRLYVEDVASADEKKDGVMADYTITLPDDGVKKHTIRLRMEDSDKKYDVYIKKKNQLKKIKTEASGHHLLVPVTGRQVELVIKKRRF